MGIVLVVLTNALLCVIFVNQLIPITFDSHTTVFATCALLSLVIAFTCLGFFPDSVETIIYCHFQDMEINDGTARKPYAMSESFQLMMAEKIDEDKEDSES